MKKKFLISLGILFIVVITAAVTYALTVPAPTYDKPSDYKVGIQYSEAIESDKPMVALFYADWCGYCLKFMPKYRTLSNIYKGKYNFVMLNVEAAENRKLVEDVVVTGYPTVMILDPKYDNRVLLNNGYYHDLKKFRVELDRYLRIRNLLNKAAKK